MKSAYTFSFILIFGFSLMSTALVGCEDDGVIEEVGEDVDEAVDDTADTLEDIGEDIEDEVD